MTFAVGLPEISKMLAVIDQIAEDSGFTKRRRSDIQVTDGLTEVRRDGELFGEERLMQSLKTNASAPLEELPGAILRDVLGIARGTIRDDAALLALKYVKPQPDAKQP